MLSKTLIEDVLAHPRSINARAELAHAIAQHNPIEAEKVWLVTSHIAALQGDFFTALAIARFNLTPELQREQISRLTRFFCRKAPLKPIPPPFSVPPITSKKIPTTPQALLAFAIQVGSFAPPLIPQEKIRQTMASIPLFGELDAQSFFTLANHATPIRFAPNTPILKQNEKEDSLYLVSHGTLKVIQQRPKENVELAITPCPTLIGEMSFLASLPHRATVYAHRPSLAWRISSQLIAQLSQRHPQLLTKMQSLMEQRLINNLLQTSSILKNLPNSEQFLASFTIRQVQPNAEIFPQGTNPPPGLFLILYGTAIVFKYTDDGRSIRVADLNEGETFGEASLLTGLPTNASIWMPNGGTLLHLSSNSYQILRNYIPQLEENLRTIMNRRNRELHSLISPIPTKVTNLQEKWFPEK